MDPVTTTAVTTTVVTTTTTGPPRVFGLPDAGDMPSWMLHHAGRFLAENPGRTVLLAVGCLLWFVVAVFRSALRP